MQNDKNENDENFKEANEKLRRKLKNVEKIHAKVRKTNSRKNNSLRHFKMP